MSAQSVYDRNRKRALGVGSYVILRGKTWNLSPISVRDFTEANAFLKRKNPSVFTELMNDEGFQRLSLELQKVALQERMRIRDEQEDLFSTKSLENWLDGEGLIFLFFRHIRKNHPEIQAFEQLREMFDPDDEEKMLTVNEMGELKLKMDEANGMSSDEAKKNLQKRSEKQKVERATAKRTRQVKKRNQKKK